MSSFTLWLNLLLHLVVYLLSCFDVLICLIFFVFALIKNSFIYSNVGQLLFFGILLLVFPAYVFCLFCAHVSLRSGLICIYS